MNLKCLICTDGHKSILFDLCQFGKVQKIIKDIEANFKNDPILILLYNL